MVLSDRTIRSEIDAGRIVIDPFDERCIQPSSVDLHVDSQFRVFANNRFPYIDVNAVGEEQLLDQLRDDIRATIERLA